ncbi:MAG: RNA-binding S4 domain-containing protein [Clostridia bacterium]
MRLDKFLKVSRLIKRRTVAAEACANGRVSVNGRVAKQSTDIKEGDVIEIAFGSGRTKIKVISISAQANKENAREMYEIAE